MITELTAEQEAKLPVWRDKWLAIGLSTEPCDFEKAKEAASRAYEAAGLTPPDKWLLADSPVHCAKMAAEERRKETGRKGKITKEEIRQELSAQAYGCHEAAWLSFYDYFHKVLKLECCNKMSGLIDLAKYCGWWAPYDTVCILQHRPETICMDVEKRLHNETGPAVRYRDGFSVYAHSGIRIPGEWIEKPETLTPEVALKVSNTEQRRVACQMLGWDNILKLLDAKPIDIDPEERIGQLYEVNHPALEGPARFLRVLCPTGRWFAKPVPLEMKTALEANAWGWRLKPEQYCPIIES